jgi:hypothetical protein
MIGSGISHRNEPAHRNYMQTERRRAPRHLLGGTVEVTDLESEKQIATLARNLSLFVLLQPPLLSLQERR